MSTEKFLRILMRVKEVAALFLLLLGCAQGNFKSPLATDTGYLYPGAAALTANDDGTYLLTWPLPPVEKSVFKIYRRVDPEPYNFSKPFAQTEKQLYLTEDLRFAPKTCFVVRFFVDGYEGDKNTNEVCTTVVDFKFAGADSLIKDDKNIWTLSWQATPFKKTVYRIFEADPNGSLQPTPLREVGETSTRLGPYAIGVLKCFVVRMVVGGNSDGDSNSVMRCTDSNRIGKFTGIERATSESTGSVTLEWTPADNENVVGYLVYSGTTFVSLASKVDLRQSSSVSLSDLPPSSQQTFGVRALALDGSEDTNTRTMSVVVRDMRPPAFAGIDKAELTGKGEVKLTWSPTSVAERYHIYVGSAYQLTPSSNPQPDFSQPYMTISDASVSQVYLQNLADESRYVFVVRAVSRFDVEDNNLVDCSERKNFCRSVDIPDQGAPVFRGLKSAAMLPDGTVKLTWDAAIGRVNQYDIYAVQGAAASIDWSKPRAGEDCLNGSAAVVNCPWTSYIVAGFQANKQYTFAVRAKDASNQDSNTATVELTVGQQSLPQFYGYIGVSALAERTLKVDFNVTNNSDIIQYRVRTKKKGATSWIDEKFVPQPLDLTKTSFVSYMIGSDPLMSPLRPNTEYEILVTALDRWGNESNNTATIKVATLDETPPSFSGVLTAEQAAGSPDLKLTWPLRSSNDIDKYVVYWAKIPMDGSQLSVSGNLPTGVQKTALLEGTATGYTMSNLDKGLTYYFVVHALDVFGNEDKNLTMVSATVRNSYPSLVADITTMRTPEREPAVMINLTATDTNMSDALSIVRVSTTCPSTMNLPELTLMTQLGGVLKAQVNWTPSQDFIVAGVSERTCIATYKSFDGEASSPLVLITLTAYNRAPRNVTATIAPVAGGYKRNQNLVCNGAATDDDGNPLSYDYQWIKNGVLISTATSSTLTPAMAAYSPNDRVLCRAGASDGHDRIVAESSEVVMDNTAPVVSTFSIQEDGGTAPLKVGDQIVCVLSVTDPDGDPVTLGALSVESSLDGLTGWAEEALSTVPCNISGGGRTCFGVSPVVRRKALRCKLASYTDGFLPTTTPTYSKGSFATALVVNSTPVIKSVSIFPSTSFEVGSSLTCNADVADADGDLLVSPPSIRWTRDGVAITGANGTSYTVARADRNALLRCEASLPLNADGFGSAAVSPVTSLAKSYSNSVPKIDSVQVTPALDAKTGDTLTCAVSVTDPDGDLVRTESPYGIFGWFANDGTATSIVQGQTGQTLPVTQDLRNKTIRCSFGLSADSDANGAPAVAAAVSSGGVLVRNTNPVLSDVMVSAAATPAVTGTVLTCNRTISDLDGDALNQLPQYKWYSRSNAVGASSVSVGTAQNYTVRSGDRGKELTCTVTLQQNFDGQGSTAIGPMSSSNKIIPVNSEPVMSGVVVTSQSVEPFYPQMTLTCSVAALTDNDNDTLLPEFTWWDGSTQLTTAFGVDYVLTSADRGRNIRCAAVLPENADGWGSLAQTVYSNNVIVVSNRAPVSNFAPSVVPASGFAQLYRSASAECVVPATVLNQADLDGDLVSFKYLWKKNGQAGPFFPGTTAEGLSTPVLDLSTDPTLIPSQNLICQVVVSDGLATVSSLWSPAAPVVNRRPVLEVGAITSISPQVLYASVRQGYNKITCAGTQWFSDPDGDPLTFTYTFKKRPNGQAGVTTLLSTNPNNPEFTASTGQTWAAGDSLFCDIVATDTYSGSISLTYSGFSGSTPFVQVLPSVPTASFLSCNGGNTNLTQFVNETFSTAACSTDFSDGDGDSVQFDILPSPDTTCPYIGTSINFDAGSGSLSGVIPATPCKVVLAMKDATNYALNDLGQRVTETIYFSPPFLATWGTATLNSQCYVSFGTSFTPAALSYGSSTFSLSALVQQNTVGGNQLSTQQGSISGYVNPSSGGGSVQATWRIVSNDPSKFQLLSKSVQISDSPSVGGVPTEPVLMPGIQVTPKPDTATGLRADGCALADCTGRAGSLSAGYDHSCVVGANGKLYCWGDNTLGQLGLGDLVTPSVSGPMEVLLPAGLRAKAVSASGSPVLGTSHTCVTLEASVNGAWEDRGVYCWGDNQYGQLGRGTSHATALSQASPQGVEGLSGASMAVVVRGIATGAAHSCVILSGASATSGGGVRCWGANDKGQLGAQTLQDSSLPLTPIGYTSAGASGIAVGSNHTCVVTNVQTVQCWGSNDSFQLGVQWTSDQQSFWSYPQAVPNLTGVVALAAGDKHTCALLNTGVVKCWGSNAYGQLGDGNSGGTTDQPSPLLGSAVGSSDRAVAITAGGNHSCALLESGSMRCWGSNSMGQLGVGTSAPSDNRPNAVSVLDLANQGLAIDAGYGHTCVLKSTGGVSCFGYVLPSGLTVPQKKPLNDTITAPNALFRNCRVLRAFDL
ncbi:MAG: hypothetical protein RIR26_2645 [Pseudomonadota bacterium]|jgi:alpha-tubulin suppressor-like RCC1 family protein